MKCSSFMLVRFLFIESKLFGFQLFLTFLQFIIFCYCFLSFSPHISCRQHTSESDQTSPESEMNAIWQKELNDYLSTIERSTASSLRKIQTDFSSTGLEFDKKFRRNFLRITNNR